MPDVRIDYETMDRLNRQLTSIVTELEEATGRSEELEAAIGNPYGESRLRDRAREFEERWDSKRSELAEQLEGIQEHVDEVITGFREGDTEMASAMEGDG